MGQEGVDYYFFYFILFYHILFLQVVWLLKRVYLLLFSREKTTLPIWDATNTC